MRRLSFPERFAVITMLGQTFGVVGTVFRVQTTEPEQRREVAGVRYAELAAGVFTASTLAAVWLAFDDLEDEPQPKRVR